MTPRSAFSDTSPASLGRNDPSLARPSPTGEHPPGILEGDQAGGPRRQTRQDEIALALYRIGKVGVAVGADVAGGQHAVGVLLDEIAPVISQVAAPRRVAGGRVDALVELAGPGMLV